MISFIKQFLVYGFSSVLGKIAAVLLLPLYTSVLSQEEYGAMAMIAAAKGLIDLISNLNIHSGVARDYYEETIDRSTLISTGFFSILFCSIAVLVTLYIFKSFLVRNLNVNNYEKCFVVMLLTIPTGSLFSYFSILTRFKQSAGLYAIGIILQLIIQIFLTIIFVIFLKSGINGIFYGILCGELAGIMLFFYINRSFIAITFDKILLKRVLQFSIPTLPAILAVWADSSIGQVLIGKYISLSEAGVYSIALRISSIYLLIRVALGNVWHPYVYENHKLPEFEHHAIRIYHSLTVVLLFVTVNLALLSDKIVILLSNEHYIVAGKYLTILTVPMSISILASVAGIGPIISRKTKYISYAEICGSATNLILLALLLPTFGALSVPLSLGTSRIIAFSLASYFTYKEIALSFPFRNMIIFPFVAMACYLIRTVEINNLSLYIGLALLNLAAILYFLRHYKVLSFLPAGRPL